MWTDDLNDTAVADHRTRTVRVELLYLDVAGCSRCDGTQHNLAAAVALLRPVLEAIDAAIAVSITAVTSAEQAQRVQLVSSPTIRVDGADIGGELTENACTDCSPGGVAVSCRTWQYHGATHSDAPVGLIVDAVLARLYGQRALPAQPQYPGLPENLRQFFGARDQQAT